MISSNFIKEKTNVWNFPSWLVVMRRTFQDRKIRKSGYFFPFLAYLRLMSEGKEGWENTWRSNHIDWNGEKLWNKFQVGFTPTAFFLLYYSSEIYTWWHVQGLCNSEGDLKSVRRKSLFSDGSRYFYDS